MDYQDRDPETGNEYADKRQRRREREYDENYWNFDRQTDRQKICLESFVSIMKNKDVRLF